MIVFVMRVENGNHRTLSKRILEYVYTQVCGEKMDLTRIHKNQYGKPYYDDGFYYNISHSKNYIVVVVDDDEVGIDIEEPRKVDPTLSKRILKDNENIIEGNILNNWVLKEAYVKYLGVGLHLDFRNVSTGTILKTENVINLSTKDYCCYVVSKNPANVEIVRLSDAELTRR